MIFPLSLKGAKQDLIGLFRLEKYLYKDEAKAGKLLVWQLKQNTWNIISVIKKIEPLVSSFKERNEVIQNFNAHLHTSSPSPEQCLSDINLPKLSSNQAEFLNNLITKEDVQATTCAMKIRGKILQGFWLGN